MFDSLLDKFLTLVNIRKYFSIIFLGIESHYHRNTQLLKNRHIIIGAECEILRASIVHRSAESNEFARNYPIKVSVLDFFIVLILR